MIVQPYLIIVADGPTVYDTACCVALSITAVCTRAHSNKLPYA